MAKIPRKTETNAIKDKKDKKENIMKTNTINLSQKQNKNLIDIFSDKDEKELDNNSVIKEKKEEELTSTQFMKQVKILTICKI